MNRDELQQHATVRLFQANNALQTFLDHQLKQDKLTAKQFFMMIIIGSFDSDPKLGDLAERFGTSHQNVRQILKKLSNNGFVELYKDEQDSRITRTRFTEQSMMYWSNRSEDDQKTMNQLYQNIDNDTMTSLVQGLMQILDTLAKWRN